MNMCLIRVIIARIDLLTALRNIWDGRRDNNGMNKKKCIQCEIEKDISKFDKDIVDIDGYEDFCIECMKKRFNLSNIYIIEANGSYKIGESKNPDKRLKQLQTGNHCWLKINKVYKNIQYAKNVEKLLHKRLNFCHLEGEWFRCDIEKIYKIIDDTLKEIKNNRAWYSKNN